MEGESNEVPPSSVLAHGRVFGPEAEERANTWYQWERVELQWERADLQRQREEVRDRVSRC
jgi:hypothetical protein